MDLESFLQLEKRHLAEERQRLNKQNNKASSFTPLGNTTASMVPEDRNTSNQPNEEDSLSKKTKDWINKQHNSRKTDDIAGTSNGRKKKNHAPDDMEQWVSDTFYSYFPGFNNEYQKRQKELQKRQSENQENLIKHQMLNKNQSRNNRHLIMETSHINSARSNNSSLTSNGANGSSHDTGKTEMEIINVNNPNYIPSKHSGHSLRPDSARYRLLQDLRHTNLTNMINDSPEHAMEMNKRQAEIESARKKEYQQELMQQIEEKRRTIKLLRDKELEQEEVLTRRLQEQLKTMKLEEQLEKERIKAVKVRFDTEQNRLTREHLLAKLENDSQLMADADAISNKKPLTINSETNKENISNRQDNKVYKYFSNSEKHEYNYRNRSSSLSNEIDLELDHTEMAKIERECFHLSEKICPMCDEPLKELENFCLRCQSKISFRIKSPSKQIMSQKSKSNEYDCNKSSVKHDTESDRSFFLVCPRCERLYSWCKTCTSKSDICKACQNKRNLCMTCRKTLCSFCLEEVACGKDTESLHINDSFGAFEDKTIDKEDSPKQMSFQVINNNSECVNNDNKSLNISSLSAKYPSLNNLDFINDPPYSINTEQNSVFHPDNKSFLLFPTEEDKNLKTMNIGKNNTSFYNKDYLVNTTNNDDRNIESLRLDTDKRLSRYLKNYGDLAYQTRGTQTTPITAGRRDIVIQAEHSLSIPLLREMPKMTRIETTKVKENSKELEDLQRRWDIPVVQKYTISPTSPKVVTQVGAIRKQLQMERLFSDDTDS